MPQMTSEDIVDVYETMAVITDQMLRAANDNDWDRLAQLEQQCALHVRQLKEHEPQALAGAQRVKKVDAIRRMLAADRQIRDLTSPWMARLSALINNTSTERRVARAYGV
ncbi:flagellar protein FliT [Massilia sp. 9I]|uniref:flagellar protein FliT n=1 Tax=Massilia sp. 9I TaxID=2653152 RepID=UPI0012F1C8F9|nr:flagellar protein FliT [Massilia sp. 9I]VXC67236.1 Flagellar biosynthesis protein fliT [Massilia sp. 9I]